MTTVDERMVEARARFGQDFDPTVPSWSGDIEGAVASILETAVDEGAIDATRAELVQRNFAHPDVVRTFLYLDEDGSVISINHLSFPAFLDDHGRTRRVHGKVAEYAGTSAAFLWMRGVFKSARAVTGGKVFAFDAICGLTIDKDGFGFGWNSYAQVIEWPAVHHADLLKVLEDAYRQLPIWPRLAGHLVDPAEVEIPLKTIGIEAADNTVKLVKYYFVDYAGISTDKVVGAVRVAGRGDIGKAVAASLRRSIDVLATHGYRVGEVTLSLGMDPSATRLVFWRERGLPIVDVLPIIRDVTGAEPHPRLAAMARKADQIGFVATYAAVTHFAGRPRFRVYLDLPE